LRAFLHHFQNILQPETVSVLIGTAAFRQFGL
jgi:hypothetical protein